MNSKIKLADYQSYTVVRLSVYQTFKFSNQSGLTNLFSEVEREAADVTREIQKLGFETDPIAMAQIEASGGYCKVWVRVAVNDPTRAFLKQLHFAGSYIKIP